MKSITQIKKIVFLSFVCFVTQNSFGQSLNIEVFNKTGFDLDSVFVGETYVGKIKKNGSAKVSNLSAITMQSGLPVGNPSGMIVGKNKASNIGLLCGFGMEEIKKGSFKFNIGMEKLDDGIQLVWNKH